MIKVAFQLPDHDRVKVEQSELGEHLHLSMQVPELTGVDAVLRIRPADADPDLFLVFMQPNISVGKMGAGHHFYSPHLPFFTREMFEDPVSFGAFVNGALAKFRKELLVGEMVPLSGWPDQRHRAAIEAFAAELVAAGL